MSSISSPADRFDPGERAALAAGTLAPALTPARVTRRVRVVVARTWWLRARGLLARPCPRPGEGMLFPGCTSIHTAFMGYAIDVVFLDRASVITKVSRDVRPWRFSAAARGTRHVLELASGEADRLGLTVGTRLAFDSDSEVPWAR
ncbi:MAG: DUF192 domain-containing protein [Dehalococcoidia bacterium]|nr:DUF192 domain-containing protein [Dehalococcoidia bacterium]MCA9849303.1 DUF192 domain-containing protein [Dehalococcoidia bacterium]MCA9857119.1 DUF192 domain-containing protein [Dehalococcoidia bacterium]MCB9484133.1 DUF192 domain-containing protein [Dehalococcoidia bacterium]MCB9491187.1 DUF192 domain-containing protein [Dehalococcoidia bacterium]